MARQSDDGDIVQISPKESNWYTLYVNNPMVDDDRFQNKFRRRFRLPFSNYEELARDCKGHELFKRWTGCNAAGKESSLIKLIVLGALRYLGRGWTFDDLEEATAISQEVHRVFFTSSLTLAVNFCMIVMSFIRLTLKKPSVIWVNSRQRDFTVQLDPPMP